MNQFVAAVRLVSRIPEDQLENVVRPFYRLDNSRNRLSGGTGLGLAIVDEVAKGHGGSLKLVNKKEGGLRAILRLPKSGTMIAAQTAAQ
jgi:signal transduction histidine kinase